MTIDPDADPRIDWQRPGGTLSEKTACKEFGFTREEIVRAIRAGKLRYRESSMHGNPWLRLLRHEVEALVSGKQGRETLQSLQAKTELARIDRELKQLKKRSAALEARKAQLKSEFGGKGKR